MQNHPYTSQRTIGHIDYREGQDVPLAIETGAVLYETSLLLQVSITNTGTEPEDERLGGIINLIRNIQIELGEQDQVLHLDGKGLLEVSRLDYSVPPHGFTATDATASTTTIYEVMIPIAHFLPGSINPLQTALDLRNVQSATMRVTWGGIDHIWNTPNGATVDSVSLEVIGSFLRNVPASTPRLLVRDLSMTQHMVTATQDGFRVKYDKRTSRYLRSVRVVPTRDGVGRGTNSSHKVITGDVSVYSGAENFLRVPAYHLAARHAAHHNAIVSRWMYPVWFSHLGDPGQMIDTNELDSPLVCEFSVIGPISGEVTALTAYAESIRAPRLG